VKNSGVAIASLVLGILIFLTCGITAIPAVICGIIALVKISGSDGSLKGKGMAITGLALSAVSIVLLPVISMLMAILMPILMPAMTSAKSVAYRTVCESNMHGLAIAMMVYANDYDNRVPTADEWCDLLIQEADVSSASFLCPSAPDGTCTYALNKNLVTLDVSATTVVMFECPPGWNQVGGPELLTTEYHQGEGCNIAFADGTVEFVEAAMLEQLDWGEKSNE
jgi:prepilin-type processing-associated H-X9-DG protein